jgi:N-acetylneuraminic acid mutarotase
MKKLIAFLLFTNYFLISQTFTPKTSLPGTAREGAFSFSINNKIFVGGGFNCKDFWEYNTITDVWTQKANLPITETYRWYPTGFSINGKGYFGLGFKPGLVPTKDFWEYDTLTDTWMQKANFPGLPRAGCGHLIINGKAYIGCGGGGTTATQYNDFYEYDPLNNTWSQKATFPQTTVAFPGSFVINGKGYFASGVNVPFGSVYTWVYQYDPMLNTWTQKNNFPGIGRLGCISFVLGNEGYIGFGGSSNFANAYNDLYRYDSSNDSWTNIFSNSPVIARMHATASVVNNRVFFGTGETASNQMLSDWWEFKKCNALNPIASVNSALCEGSTINFSITLSGSTTPTYAWSGPNSFTSNVQNPAIANAGTVNVGIYTVTVNSSGCIETSTVQVSSVIPCTGIDETSNLILSSTIFPNPFNDELTIEVNEPSQITITNALGQVVKTVNVNGPIKLDTEELPKGIYVLRVKTQYATRTIKMIKE